jgi:hypothetical protein
MGRLKRLHSKYLITINKMRYVGGLRLRHKIIP